MSTAVVREVWGSSIKVARVSSIDPLALIDQLLFRCAFFFLLRRLSRSIAVSHRKESLAERGKELYSQEMANESLRRGALESSRQSVVDGPSRACMQW